MAFAGSRTGGRGTFSCTRESTQRACPGGGPPGYPPLSWGALLSFRRPGPAVAPVPSAACGLLRPYALVPAAQVTRLKWQGASVPTPLGEQARRLEHRDQAPVGVVGDSQVTCAKGRGPPGVAGSVSRCAPVNRDWHRFCAPVKRGFLGGKPCVRGTPFVPKLSRDCAPKRAFAYFSPVRKVGRPSGRKRKSPAGAGPGNPKGLPEPSGKKVPSSEGGGKPPQIPLAFPPERG